MAVNLAQAAKRYHRAGLRVLPAKLAEKRPAVGRWKQYQKRLPTDAEVSAWFANSHEALCILCGQVSGNASGGGGGATSGGGGGATSGGGEMIDFDAGGEKYDAWTQRIPPDLLAKLVIESTQHDGRHVYYLYGGEVCGNMKLAQRREGDKIVTLIETRGEGGLFLCAPTPGYKLIQGDLASPPVLTMAERDTLLQAAWDLTEYLPPVVDGPRNSTHITGSGNVGQRGRSSVGQGQLSADNPHSGEYPSDNGVVGQRAAMSVRPCGSLPEMGARPGDDFNHRGDVRAVLAEHGWVRTKGGENEYWRRPGKNAGTSATLKDGVFYVFSSNAAPFEPDRGYAPFAVYALLNHGGDYELAASSLAMKGYGGMVGNSLAGRADGPDMSGIERMSVAPGACPPDTPGSGHTLAMSDGQAEPVPEIADPGPLPDEMLRVPGLVSEVMDHTLATAPYPNQVMAFAGALSLMAFLAGRKVRDPGDNRTNLYLLGLAHSASGKDWPRKVNTKILHEVGLADALGERFASGEGIQDALFQTPTMLFQTDEIDGMLQSINKAKDARHEAIMSTLLTMYSSSNSVYPMRRKAGTPGKSPPGVIDQPCLVIFGTAIPNHYYEALSERMLTNGFFARMIILEAGARSSGQEPTIRDLPERVVEAADWWSKFHPGDRRGNLINVHPVPAVVEYSDQAKRLLVETREQAEAEYADAEAKCDSVGTTVWGRVSEQTRKLALLHAISENRQSPRIGADAVRWASAFVMHQTRRMLFMAAGHVSDNPFHAECLKAVEKLRNTPGNQLAHSVLLKRMKMDAKSFATLVETLVQQGDIEVSTASTHGRSMRAYRLVGGVKEACETRPGGERS
ncbi:DUF3987 domain-containing protein [Mucisphaera calidilacus]|uniref:DNA primase/polymerase bifunctional N-terminal domain-containing protein n=1 Tax=Mucisphaera calidilacus TaxID=2527982 RepID=A0A518BVS6_9BACT|nr:DUF3987 domain-containing protein [Mucisphaera calidilacus]QDU71057.1 hypothetical protein Pan265_09020 [Mucisphaera calidilacus]